ncbi:MAG: phosphoadenylyl-sulfate reductase [Firmicutes bacterium]|nr:phosphoadenylyl-sulfate reductase [Bacillota bacterium]
MVESKVGKGRRKRMEEVQLKDAAERLEGSPPGVILEWAVENFHPRLALTCSFGAEDIVLAHLLKQIQPDARIYFINTGLHFSDTLETRDIFTRRYGINLEEFRPSMSLADQDAVHGERLYERDSDRCCAIRKVEPLRRALAGLDGWITGLRRDQAPTRKNIKVVEGHRVGDDRLIAKINPLAAWNEREVWDYIRLHGIPYNRLFDQSYLSIGCAPCTRPVQPGEDPRSGRWAGKEKTECGLHTFTKKTG